MGKWLACTKPRSKTEYLSKQQEELLNFYHDISSKVEQKRALETKFSIFIDLTPMSEIQNLQKNTRKSNMFR